MSGAILVIGDVMVDVVARAHHAIESGTDTPADIRLCAGGSGANQAAWLAHFGVPTRLAARVGANDLEDHTRELRAYGIEPMLVADDALPTGMLVSLISADGDRSFLTDRGANARLAASDLPEALLVGISSIHVSAYALAEATSRAAVVEFLARAAAREIPYTVDPNSVALLRRIGAEAFLDLTRAASACFPNAMEAAFLADSDDPTTQLEVLSRVYPLVVVKRGASGAIAARGSERWSVAAPAANVRDTTGAGDAFVAAFLAASWRGASVPEALDRAVGAGALAVGAFGGRPPAEGHAPSER